MAELHVLRVFVDDDGRCGNPLGVFLEGRSVPRAERQRAAADLGYSETVFLDDPERGRLSIHTPATEIPFAGHPLVGTAWLLARQGRLPAALHPPAGEVPVRFEDERPFVEGRGDWSDFEALQLPDPAAVERLGGAPEGSGGDVYAWAWIDEAAGTVRARSFAPDFGIAEDEATGSAALGLAVLLGPGADHPPGEGVCPPRQGARRRAG